MLKQKEEDSRSATTNFGKEEVLKVFDRNTRMIPFIMFSLSRINGTLPYMHICIRRYMYVYIYIYIYIYIWQRPINSCQGKHDKGYHPGISVKHFQYFLFTEVSRGASCILCKTKSILHNNSSKSMKLKKN